MFIFEKKFGKNGFLTKIWAKYVLWKCPKYVKSLLREMEVCSWASAKFLRFTQPFYKNPVSKIPNCSKLQNDFKTS